jgi:integrase
MTVPRKQLPIRQRHRDDCTRPRDCACPWSFRVRLPDDTQPRVTRDTLAEAEQAYYELMARRPEPLADRTTTIAQWAERWLTTARGTDGAEWRPQTRRSYSYMVPKHILPDLGHHLVTELRRDDVRLWVTRMRERGTGPAAMGRAVELLHIMYSAWLKDDRILPRGNPVDLHLVEKQPRKEFAPLTAAQVEAIAGAMAADMALMVRAEAFYGARMSEILALREEDITFTGKDVTAPLAPQLAKLAELPAGKYEARKPRLRFERKLERDRTAGPIKNARGNRTLPLPQWLADAFASQLGQWPAVGGWLFVNRNRTAGYRGGFVTLADVAKAAGVSEKTTRTMVGAAGQRLAYSAATRRRVEQASAALGYGHGRTFPFTPEVYTNAVTKAAAKAGVMLPPRQCTHALRHHCVSVLRGKGWSDQDIGYWIGDTALTVGVVYGRPMPDALDRIAAELSAARAVGEPALRVAD